MAPESVSAVCARRGFVSARHDADADAHHALLPYLRALAKRVAHPSRREGERVASVSGDFRKRTMAVLRLAFLSSTILEFFSAVAIALLATLAIPIALFQRQQGKVMS